MHPLWYLDTPDITKLQNSSEVLQIRGWIASAQTISKIAFSAEARLAKVAITTLPRPDVVGVYGLPAIGFSADVAMSDLKLSNALQRNYTTIRFYSGSTEYQIKVPIASYVDSEKERKKRKLQRLKEHLACPHCRKSVEHDTTKMVCNSCGESFPFNSSHYNFLTPELRKEFDIIPTKNVSANEYDGVSLNFIHSLHAGLILDCGAGSRSKYYENVINYEIVPYESTDVLGVGERLPFLDNSFDAVFSFAVLEHVKDPFTCAQELLRVLKPGGALYCQVPFLQPQHGYPHHYYNMTQRGLENLFGPTLKVSELDTLTFGQPIFTLSWFLNSYLAGLSSQGQEQFKEMKVKDLLRPGGQYLGAPFVTGLSKERRDELASCNFIIGEKTVL